MSRLRSARARSLEFSILLKSYHLIQQPPDVIFPCKAATSHVPTVGERSVMPTSRRSMLVAASASVTALGISQAAEPKTPVSETNALSADVVSLIQRSLESNAALMRGDIGAYRALIALTDDFTLMS